MIRYKSNMSKYNTQHIIQRITDTYVYMGEKCFSYAPRHDYIFDKTMSIDIWNSMNINTCHRTLTITLTFEL